MSHFTIGITSTAEVLLKPDDTEQPQTERYMTEALGAANKLQVSNRLVWPVWMLCLVQLGLWEGVVEIFYGHLIERNHAPELLKLPRTNSQMGKMIKMLQNFEFDQIQSFYL